MAVFDRQVLSVMSLSPFSRPKWLNKRVRTFWFLAWCTVRDRGRVASDKGQTSFRRLCGRSAPSGFSMRFTSTHRSPPYPTSTGTNFSYQGNNNFLITVFLKIHLNIFFRYFSKYYKIFSLYIWNLHRIYINQNLIFNRFLKRKFQSMWHRVKV